MLNKLKNKQLSLDQKEKLVAYLFLAPWIFGLVVFTIYPFVSSFFLSFTDASIVNANFVGLDNFVEMFTRDARFAKSMQVTTKYALLAVPIKLMFALFIAMLLKDGWTVYRTIYYLPSIIGGSVAVAVMWRQLFGYNGLINRFLELFGVQGKEWLGHPDYALNILILLAAWQFGSSMVIFIAGLKNIPKELIEASKIDGAGKFRTFIHITLPMLSSVIQFNLVLQIIGAFQVFTQGFIITRGGPMDETLFAVHYIYDTGFKFARLGYASAISWVLLAVIAVFTAVVFFTSKYWVFYEND